MHDVQNTCLNSYILSATNAHAPMHVRLCNGVETTLPWNIAILSWVLREHRAGCCLSPALAAPSAVSTKPVAQRCSLRKSVQIHASSWHGRRCGVTRASFDHPRWCRPHPLSVFETPPNWRSFYDDLYQTQLSGCSAFPESRLQSLPQPYIPLRANTFLRIKSSTSQ